MFKKPFKTKSNNTIRGSERKKLRDAVSKQFKNLSPEQLQDLVPNKEEMSVMKIFTHGEMNVTCYILKKTPIFFECEGVLLPTVYTLWKNHCCMAPFCTNKFVFSKIQGGADFMLAGAMGGFLPSFEKGDPAFVFLAENRAAVAVGTCSSSSADVALEGPQGKRVQIFHTYKDYLWAAGDKSDPPEIPVSFYDYLGIFEGTEVSSATNEEELVNGNEEPSKELENEKTELNSAYSSQVTSSNEQETNGTLKGVEEVENSLTPPADNLEEEESPEDRGEGESDAPEQEETTESDIPELSPQEQMDVLLKNCFCQAMLDAKKIELPILVSSFSSQYLHAACPEGLRLDVKKSSYKKMSKFLQDMQSKGLVEVKELSKGVESIVSMSFENKELRIFKQSDFGQMMKQMKEMKIQDAKEAKSKEQVLEVKELYAVSAKVVPFFKLFDAGKGSVLSSSDVRKLVTSYVKDHELTSEKNKKHVKIDTLLADVLYGKKQCPETASWDVLLNMMLTNMNSCHQISIPGQEPQIRKGNVELIEISVEQRMGNKKVTLVKNLEVFGVDPKEFAVKLQKSSASSTSVCPLPGKNNPGQQVQVQGSQTKHLKDLLEQYRIPLKYVKGLDAAAKKEKKKR